MKLEQRKKLLLRLLWFGPLVLAVSLLWPVNNGITRWLIVLGALGALVEVALAAGWLYRKSRKWFYVFIAVLVILIGWIFCPGLYSTALYDRLRNEYIHELRTYAGTRYLWGGENRFGIDCSGLPRKAMRTAFWKIGLKEGNQDFYFRALENWWFDASAKALAEGYRDYVFPLNIPGTVATGPTYFLEPGDLAITDDGVHVMVYLDPDEWISADPGQGKVVIEYPSKSKNPWFTRPVHFYRFSSLRNAGIRPKGERPAIAWKMFLKGSQTGCCLDTSDTYTENTHWNIFVSFGKDFCLHFLSEKLTSKRPTGQRICGYPVMTEGEVALICMTKISGKPLLEYNGPDAAVKKIIADSKSYAAPLFYVMPAILKNETAISTVQTYYLEASTKLEVDNQ